jgi:hypothetical protein
MEKLEVGDAEELLRRIDFSEIVPSEKNALRVGSKTYILSHGIINEKFYLRNIKGNLNGIDKKPEDVRNKINVYSETELENLKRRFLNVGYLEQEEGSSAYKITTKGRYLFEAYKLLFRMHQIAKKMEYLRIDTSLHKLESLENAVKDTGELSPEMQEDLFDDFKKGVRPNEKYVNIEQIEGSQDQIEIAELKDKFLIGATSLRDIIMSLNNYQILEPEKDISEEKEELLALADKLNENASVPDFEIPDSTEEPALDWKDKINNR